MRRSYHCPLVYSLTACAGEYIAPFVSRNKNWHVVTAGTRVGVFQTWHEASTLVLGISGSVNEAFKAHGAAVMYYQYNKKHNNVYQLSR